MNKTPLSCNYNPLFYAVTRDVTNLTGKEVTATLNHSSLNEHTCFLIGWRQNLPISSCLQISCLSDNPGRNISNLLNCKSSHKKICTDLITNDEVL
ncbi:hypothetical protein NPIL_661571 [Nephila pilipes]|uniref:Uncharacterized protein n=1 Tax=Nephila pilipes TaxID=299642 RepID=A0A8X6Q8V2_NEPPI|nr:hypothetical protein NPIL_661571 [Nephila pilipes]